MPAITSLGIGSGLDINTMVAQLVALESRPLTQMRRDAGALQTQVSSYGQLSSLFGTLQSAANKLTESSLWSKSTASSSDDAAVSVVGGSSAAAGSYAVTVQKLASNQTVVSASSYADADTLVGAGSLTLELGNWDLPPMNFLPQVGRTPATVAISSTDTLATLRDKINGLGAGVTASIVSDSGGARLALRSGSTGADNGFRVQVADADGNNADATGLSRFAFDPGGGSNQMEQKVAAQNAQATVNGINVVSASNELGSVIEGLTLRLRKETTSATDIAVSSDRDAVKGAVQGFADAYNALTKAITEQTKYDPASRVGGPLQGDSAATSLQRQLRALLNVASGASTTFSRLSDVGLQLQRDGTLNVNSGKLDTATANLVELKKAFSNSDSQSAANDGFARRYASLATAVLGSDGSLSTRSEGLRQRLTQNDLNQSKLTERVERFRSRLVAQYTAMDASLSKLNALGGYVTQQLNVLNGTRSSSR